MVTTTGTNIPLTQLPIVRETGIWDTSGVDLTNRDPNDRPDFTPARPTTPDNPPSPYNCITPKCYDPFSSSSPGVLVYSPQQMNYTQAKDRFMFIYNEINSEQKLNAKSEGTLNILMSNLLNLAGSIELSIETGSIKLTNYENKKISALNNQSLKDMLYAYLTVIENRILELQSGAPGESNKTRPCPMGNRRSGDPDCEPAPVIPAVDSSSLYNDELCSQIKESINQLWSYMGRYKDQLTQSEHEYLKGEYDELVELYESNCDEKEGATAPVEPTVPKCNMEALAERSQVIISQLETVSESKAQVSGRSSVGINRLTTLLNDIRTQLNTSINLCSSNSNTPSQDVLNMITALDIAPVPESIAMYSVQPNILIKLGDTLRFVEFNPPTLNPGSRQMYKLMYNENVVMELNDQGVSSFNAYFNEDGNIYDSEDIAPDPAPVNPVQPQPPTNSSERVRELNEARRSLYCTSRPLTNQVADILAEQITQAINTPNAITVLDKTNGSIPLAYALIYSNITNPLNVKAPHFRKETSFSSSMGIGYRLWNNNREIKGAGTDAMIFNQWGESYNGVDQNGNYTPDKTFPFMR